MAGAPVEQIMLNQACQTVLKNHALNLAVGRKALTLGKEKKKNCFCNLYQPMLKNHAMLGLQLSTTRYPYVKVYYRL